MIWGHSRMLGGGKPLVWEIRNALVRGATLEDPSANWKKNPSLLEKAIDQGDRDPWIIREVLTTSHWNDESKWINKMLEKQNLDSDIAEFYIEGMDKKDTKNLTRLIKTLIERAKADRALARYFVRHPGFPVSTHPEWIEQLVRRGNADSEIALYFKKIQGQPAEKYFRALCKRNDITIEDVRSAIERRKLPDSCSVLWLKLNLR